MSAGDVSAAASKYLWGLRSEADPSDPNAIDEVLIVSSGPSGSVFDAENARIRGIQAVPQVMPLATSAAVDELVGG